MNSDTNIRIDWFPSCPVPAQISSTQSRTGLREAWVDSSGLPSMSTTKQADGARATPRMGELAVAEPPRIDCGRHATQGRLGAGTHENGLLCRLFGGWDGGTCGGTPRGPRL